MTDAPTRAADAEQRDAMRAVFAVLLHEIDHEWVKWQNATHRSDGTPTDRALAAARAEALYVARLLIVKHAAAAGVELE